MFRFILMRLGGLMGVLLAVSLLTFFLMHMIPGGPFDAMTVQTAQMIPQELVENLEKLYGLDKPVWQQYLLFLKAALRGDFGYSYYASGRTISELIQEHWPYSIHVGLMTLAFSSVVGLSLGIISAMNPGRWPDFLGTGVSLFCMTVPSFVFAKLMQYVLAVKLGWLPTAGWEGPKYWIMPVLANSLGPVLTLQRYTRSAISDVMRSNYVRTARAKGLNEGKVTLIHIFKNALTPVVTVAGPMTASLITGSIFIEGIFRIPGLGWYTNVSIGRRDYPLIIASTLLWTTLISITYFITDIVYALLDPRVAYVKER
ncbi:MAG: ABC transporter permease [Anaerolineae bacterium]|nr:ABC transporter permease [Anaerolineae bacterium]